MSGWTSRRWRYTALGAVLAVLLLVLTVYAWRVDGAHWEIALMRSLQEAGVPWLRDASALLAVAGHGLPWVGLVAVLALLLLLAGSTRMAVWLAFTATLQDAGSLIKLLVERARPAAGTVDVWQEISSYSFPSGHTLGATLVFGFLFFALERTRLPVALRRTGQALCLGWIVLMGTGRVVLGAHWPTDVLGAYLVGALLLLPMVYLLRRPIAPALLDGAAPTA